MAEPTAPEPNLDNPQPASPVAGNTQRSPNSVWTTRIILVLVVAVVLPVLMSIIYTYPPADNTFYPGCIFNKVTGLHCPGCGATRCVHALLHLDFTQAVAWNPIFVLMLPIIIYGLSRIAYEMWTGSRAKEYRWPKWATKVIMWMFITFWIVRNIPYEPFTELAPHRLEREVAERGEP